MPNDAGPVRATVGATGAILAVKLMYELERTGGRYGHEVMCCGGGIGTAQSAVLLFQHLGQRAEL